MNRDLPNDGDKLTKSEFLRNKKLSLIQNRQVLFFMVPLNNHWYLIRELRSNTSDLFFSTSYR